MISTRRQPLLRRVPGWLIILTTLMTASVIAERVQAATGSSNADGTEYHPRISRLMTRARGRLRAHLRSNCKPQWVAADAGHADREHA